MTSTSVTLGVPSAHDAFVFSPNVMCESCVSGPIETRFNVYPDFLNSKPLAASYTAPDESIILENHTETALADSHLATAAEQSFATHHSEHSDTWVSAFAFMPAEINLLV